MKKPSGPVSRARWEATCLAWPAIFLAITICSTPRLQAQTFQILYSFHGPDGALPSGRVIVDASGNLYGTTLSGGAPSACRGCGTVFKIDPSGNETVLYSFTGGSDGSSPDQGLVRDQAGNLYGVTPLGGDTIACEVGCGGVYRVDPAGQFTVLHTFQGGSDGAGPDGSLTLDAAGNLYGNTQAGGDPASCGFINGCGTVFKVDSAGNETVLHTFDGLTGSVPYGALLLSRDGTLLGTSLRTGQAPGTIFRLSTDGGAEDVVLRDTPNMSAPISGVVEDPVTGQLYGTNAGAVVQVDPTTLLETWLHTFTGGEDGSDPLPLVQDAFGNLYGTTRVGGLVNPPNNACPVGCGVVYQLTRSGKYTVLYRFTGGADGRDPGPLSIDQQGNLLGVTFLGGDLNCVFAGGCGTVFKITLPRVDIGGLVQTPLTRDIRGNISAVVIITNNGNLTVDSAQVRSIGTTLGSTRLLSAPPPVTNLAPGASARIPLTFPSEAVTNGTAAVSLRVTGTYSASSVDLPPEK